MILRTLRFIVVVFLALVIAASAASLFMAVRAVLRQVRPTVVYAPVTHRQFKFVSFDGGESVLPGDSIRSTAGPCVELWLSGRIDTIACNVAYVTDVTGLVPAPPAPQAPEAEAEAGPTIMGPADHTVAKL